MAFDIFFMTDQPEMCRQCGTRTDFVDLSKTRQLHHCRNCQFTYWLEDGTVPCVNCFSTNVVDDLFENPPNDIPAVWCKSCGTNYPRDASEMFPPESLR
jgi:hypothetical protein